MAAHASPPAVTAVFRPAASGPWAKDMLRPFVRLLGRLRPTEARDQRHLALGDREFNVSGKLDGGSAVHLAVAGGLLTVTLAAPAVQPAAADTA